MEEPLSNSTAPASEHAAILRMIQASKAASAAGDPRQGEALLARAAQLAPAHPAVLNELGLHMMQRGDAQKARELFRRATSTDPNHPSLWSNLAQSLHILGLPAEAMEALERALTLEPRHPAALLQKGAILEERGEVRKAAQIYRAALATVGPEITAPPTLGAALERARAAVRRDEEALSRTIEERIASIRARHLPGDSARVQWCIDLLTGRRTRYVSQPTFLYFPGLPALEFFDNAEFQWLGAIESATDEIRNELTAVLDSEVGGLEPYVAYPQGVPLDQWRELNQSRRWSAYFLWKEGVAQPQHMARCPRTTAALKDAPQCDIEQHGPNAFFSILEPHTRIPPHTGVTNARLTVHVPLVVPPGCGFRVGGDRREWTTGKAWVFDDTIEHEAWNDSDMPRAVLIFDIWNPYLGAAERELVRAATEAVGWYYKETPPELT
jgi:aspartyl/asparaginyl beta-hydroxylase (cupin superfamily)/Tfp pilus assembly protein PilF